MKRLCGCCTYGCICKDHSMDGVAQDCRGLCMSAETATSDDAWGDALLGPPTDVRLLEV